MSNGLDKFQQGLGTWKDLIRWAPISTLVQSPRVIQLLTSHGHSHVVHYRWLWWAGTSASHQHNNERTRHACTVWRQPFYSWCQIFLVISSACLTDCWGPEEPEHILVICSRYEIIRHQCDGAGKCQSKKIMFGNFQYKGASISKLLLSGTFHGFETCTLL